jgi:O-antigen ligase
MSSRIVFILLCFYFWVGAVWQGYYAETAYLCSNVILFTALLVVICRKRELVLSRIHIFVFLFVAVYWIAAIHSVDPEQAILESARVSALLPLSLFIQMIPADSLKRLYGLWPWVGAMLTIIGLALAMERNGRLESTLEYANALAIFLLVNIGVSMLLYLQERRVVHLALLAVNAVGLLLTFSRSVWVLWLILALAALIWFPELRKRRMWISIGAAHLCSVVIAFLIKGDALFFWQRVSSIQSKTSEFQIRLVYWKDSLGVIRDYWWSGTGGGGWNVLLHLYRSQDYFVRYVHNHFVQITLDTGVLGLIVFAGWLGVFYRSAVHKLRVSQDREASWIKGVILFVSVMTLHAGFDFDFTFPFLFGLFLCMTIPMDPNKVELRLSGKAIAIAVPVSVAVIGLWTWMAIGYGYKQSADFQVRAGQYSKGQELFTTAERLLPWSSATLYESAKGYVRQGNATGDGFYYRLAREKLIAALERVPEQTLYSDLLQQLPVNSK